MNTTKEKILEAAKICPDVERVMRTLFPEAFSDPEGEFLIGDIVEGYNVSDSSVLDDKVGKVVVIAKTSDLYGVDFQKIYADGHNLDGLLAGKTGWFIRGNQLKLIFRDETGDILDDTK